MGLEDGDGEGIEDEAMRGEVENTSLNAWVMVIFGTLECLLRKISTSSRASFTSVRAVGGRISMVVQIP